MWRLSSPVLQFFFICLLAAVDLNGGVHVPNNQPKSWLPAVPMFYRKSWCMQPRRRQRRQTDAAAKNFRVAAGLSSVLCTVCTAGRHRTSSEEFALIHTHTYKQRLACRLAENRERRKYTLSSLALSLFSFSSFSPLTFRSRLAEECFFFHLRYIGTPTYWTPLT